MESAICDIDSLLRAVQSRPGHDGLLAPLRGLLEPLEPSLVVLADERGEILMADRRDSQIGDRTVRRFARDCAGRLGSWSYRVFEFTERDCRRLAFAVRIEHRERSQVLGGCVKQSTSAQSWLRQTIGALVACGELACEALTAREEQRKLSTENRHLKAEHNTLRAAHTTAMIDAIREREERLAMESQQLALEQFLDAAERANRSKSEFLASMSHEIRTPMTAILGFTDLLLETLEGPEELQQVETIKRNGEYLLEIINDILDISKIEAGKLEVEPARCSPHEIVTDAISLLKVRAAGKGLRLFAEFPEPIPQRIVTDPTRARQILLNLVGNAIKFTEQGEVRLLTRLVDKDDRGPRLRFDVIDTGIGMTAEQVAGLFRPFVQVDKTAARVYGGTGLGLTISKRLAEMLGGEIAVSSSPGEGSTFTVTIATGPLDGVPLTRIDEDVRAPEGEPKKPARRETPKLDCRILLAEDSPDNQRLFTFVLKKAGAHVTLAENGSQAVAECLAASRSASAGSTDAQPGFDIVLMDVDMPVMNGLEAVKHLRETGFQKPIIALTAHAMQQQIQMCLAAGFDYHLSKPIDPAELVGVVAGFQTKRKTRQVD